MNKKYRKMSLVLCSSVISLLVLTGCETREERALNKSREEFYERFPELEPGADEGGRETTNK